MKTRRRPTVFRLSPGNLLGETELIIHGTTVATNALVQRKGAKVGLLTTAGFRDLLEMREGLKEDRYNLRMTPVEPLVPRYLRLGVTERVRSDGSVDTTLDEASVERAIQSMKAEGVEALAICFLFSYLNPDHELRAAEMVRAAFPGMYMSTSHEILPQIKEFDRLSTTVVNTYVGPVLGVYLSRLQRRLEAFRQAPEILIMQSNGGVAPIEDSVRQAVRAILSGPAGGVAAAAHYGQLLGESKVIGFDMGGHEHRHLADRGWRRAPDQREVRGGLEDRRSDDRHTHARRRRWEHRARSKELGDDSTIHRTFQRWVGTGRGASCASDLTAPGLTRVLPATAKAETGQRLQTPAWLLDTLVPRIF